MSRRRPPPESRTLGDIVHGIVADIREKVVEEPWFNRPLGPGQPVPHFYEIMWGQTRESDQQAQAQAQERDEPEIER
ncbi:hypothetical protein [Phenylobacterium sp.]|jgi:hypothetical protein|uniref:hypothetical protein n=1 Tax=Phenylobacterium sp. TaxID=1871053 RepID=UPI000C96558D|nr:hypothetical protein [Phenylobacterium sp.]MAK82387.1 hypothetical protein [Phenylobacterium sp.]|tara:strand:+ start:3342 stop:3572 length:231 start_codon:yes stop_codon:yes gene_type:complete